MDALLELLEKYRCHLNRGNKSTPVMLENNFKEYLSDLESTSLSEKNPLTGTEMRTMVLEKLEEIKGNAFGLIEALKKYDNGEIVSASIDAFSIFDNMKPQLMTRYSGAFRQEVYYRITGNGFKTGRWRWI